MVISNNKGIHELPDELPNDLRLRKILGLHELHDLRLLVPGLSSEM